MTDPIDKARDSVMEYMWHGGARAGFLTGEEWRSVYLAGDGFGLVTHDFANGELEWDWSHVRDSSPAAIAAMHSKLIEVLEARFCHVCDRLIFDATNSGASCVCDGRWCHKGA